MREGYCALASPSHFIFVVYNSEALLSWSLPLNFCIKMSLFAVVVLTSAWNVCEKGSSGDASGWTLS